MHLELLLALTLMNNLIVFDCTRGATYLFKKVWKFAPFQSFCIKIVEMKNPRHVNCKAKYCFPFCDSTICKNHAISAFHTSSFNLLLSDIQSEHDFLSTTITFLPHQIIKERKVSSIKAFMMNDLHPCTHAICREKTTRLIYTQKPWVNIEEWKRWCRWCPRSEHFNLFHPLLYSKHSHGF